MVVDKTLREAMEKFAVAAYGLVNNDIRMNLERLKEYKQRRIAA